MAKKTQIKEGIDLGEFILANTEKYNRVIDGVVGQGGAMTGGLGKDAPLELIIANYDKLGGLILNKQGERIAMGSFWNFEEKKPREIPLVTLKVNRNATGAPIITSEEVGDEPKKGRKRKVEED